MGFFRGTAVPVSPTRPRFARPPSPKTGGIPLRSDRSSEFWRRAYEAMKVTGSLGGPRWLCAISLALFREVCACARGFRPLDLVAMR